jgi:hypothetical protein
MSVRHGQVTQVNWIASEIWTSSAVSGEKVVHGSKVDSEPRRTSKENKKGSATRVLALQVKP